MLRLVAKYGGELRRQILFEDRPVSIGAAEGNDFVIRFPGVSRQHARAERTPDGVRLVDLDSKNGLIVGQERRSDVVLRTGDCVHLGRATVYVEAVADDDLEVAVVVDSVEVGSTGPTAASVKPLRGARPRETAPHWVLPLVRELDHLKPDADETTRAGVLARTAQAVGADGLWTFAVVEHDLFLRDFVGAVPSDEAIALVTARVSGTDPKAGGTTGLEIELDGPRGRILACPPPTPAGLLLVATFPSGRVPAGWVADLLAHVAERLGTVEAGPRLDDLQALVGHFARLAARRYGKRILGLGRGALALVQSNRWEGRLRELEHAVAGAVLRCPDGEVVEIAHFADLTYDSSVPPDAGEPAAQRADLADETLVVGSFPTLQARIEAVEKQALREALERTGGDRKRAAGLLGVTPQSLEAKITRHGLDR